jgi:predicted ATP-grasp superfamily ATP-dependent carboligase
VCSRAGRSLAGASRFALADDKVGDALTDPEAFARGVAALSQRVAADVLIPVSEASLLAVLQHAGLFGHLVVPFPVESQFRRVCDKQAVLEAARGVGIAVPRQHSVADEHALISLVEAGAVAFPLVIKPSRSVVGDAAARAKVGVSYAANPAELLARARSYAPAAYPLLLQQRIVGPGVGVFLLRWDGETLAAFAHQRLREKPPSGGISVYSESIALDGALRQRAEALLDRFSWRGVAMVEFKIDSESETPYLMEINGRFWGSLQLAIAAGVDFPALLVKAALGEPIARVEHYRVGVRNRWWWGDVDHLLARLRRSDEELSLPPGSPRRGRAILEFFRWRAGDRNEVIQLDDLGPSWRETKLWLQRR